MQGIDIPEHRSERQVAAVIVDRLSYGSGRVDERHPIGLEDRESAFDHPDSIKATWKLLPLRIEHLQELALGLSGLDQSPTGGRGQVRGSFKNVIAARP